MTDRSHDERKLAVARFLCLTFICPLSVTCGSDCEPGEYALEKADSVLRIADAKEPPA